MKTIVVLSLILSAASSISADGWWQWNDGQWCFRSDVKKACLPSEYLPIEMVAGQVKFVARDPVLPARFVEFHFGPLAKSGKGRYPHESFILSSEQESESTHLSKYIADVRDGANHDATLFLIVLDDQFTLLIYGSEGVGISHLANSIVQQWSDELRF